jgi:hypothetical protein
MATSYMPAQGFTLGTCKARISTLQLGLKAGKKALVTSPLLGQRVCIAPRPSTCRYSSALVRIDVSICFNLFMGCVPMGPYYVTASLVGHGLAPSVQNIVLQVTLRTVRRLCLATSIRQTAFLRLCTWVLCFGVSPAVLRPVLSSCEVLQRKGAKPDISGGLKFNVSSCRVSYARKAWQ